MNEEAIPFYTSTAQVKAPGWPLTSIAKEGRIAGTAAWSNELNYKAES